MGIEPKQYMLGRIWHDFQFAVQNANEGDFWLCTDHCKWIANRITDRKTEIWGYLHEDNPTATIGEPEGGHDFLIVGDRYIVDFWYKLNYDNNFPLFVPLEDAEKYYGDRSKWELVPKT